MKHHYGQRGLNSLEKQAMNVHVLVPAAGSGRRLGGPVGKQYLPLGNQSILSLTLARLCELDQVTHIHLIVPPADIGACHEMFAVAPGVSKLTGIIPGGPERQDSVRLGLEACAASDQDVILVHDGVRPFFPALSIAPLIDAALACGAALLALPVQDTIKKVADARVQLTLDRALLWQAQTPQAFLCQTLREAHGRAHAEGHRGTDDASLVEWCGWPVAVIHGSAHNVKITTPADLAMARALLALNQEFLR